MMEGTNRQPLVDEAEREQSNREELVARIAHATRHEARREPLKGLHLFRVPAPTELTHGVMRPALCVIAQGSKEIFLGEERYRYDPAHYLLATVELPIVSQVIEAMLERPYLSLRLDLEPALVSSVMVEAGHLAPRSPAMSKALHVSALDGAMLDAAVRLVRLIDSPADARFLMPLVARELIYRLLIGEQGERLRHLVQGGQSNRIVKAIERLRVEFDQPLRIDDIAHDLGMSVSGFHHHFKAVTAMSPLKFQKQLRLQEARRLMLAGELDAASTAYRVGYEDASHFNREYKKLFGAPPMRDVERLRAAPPRSAAAGFEA